ncbi:MAG: diacylglycerol kinase family lipid kinase [Planctomycetes bacterium]|nr:diacylglycerol kinase family lipid kinase [Planctomycetota bacterium]
MPRILIIANPVSGRGRGARVVATAEKRFLQLGDTVEALFTSKRGDAQEFARRAGGFDRVVGVGGDGTMNEILNGLGPDAPPLGQIPVGTANVLAKTFGLPRAPRPAADLIHAGHTLDVDLGTANGRRFLLMASAGFDAQVVYDFHRQRIGAIKMSQYFTWSIRAIFKYEPPRMRVTADGVKLPDGSFVLVSNLPCYGGPLAFTRTAKVRDGALDLLVYSSWGKINVVRLFAEAFAGDPCSMPGATHVRAKNVRIEADKPLPWQVDGDPGEKLPLEVGILPKGVKLLVPRDTKDWIE